MLLLTKQLTVFQLKSFMRRKFRKPKPKKTQEKRFRANQQIHASSVLLIDENGEKLGEISIQEALQKAKEADMDLIEVNPKGEPPVAKIGDLGKMKYDQEKKAHKQRQQQKKVEVKGIRLSVRISKHDFDLRVRQGQKFLEKGNKLKVELTLKGREKQHPEKAREMVQSFIAALREDEELNIIEEQPLTRQGGKYIIILVNKK